MSEEEFETHLHNLRNKYVKINMYFQFRERLEKGQVNHPEKTAEHITKMEEQIYDINREFVEMLQKNQ